MKKFKWHWKLRIKRNTNRILRLEAQLEDLKQRVADLEVEGE